MIRAADFSPCMRYRYTLKRRWGDGPMLLWVLLNPSTADAEHDDPTNRRGIAFSGAWGYRACCFVNLFAFRATHPRDLKLAGYPIGPDNDRHIYQQAVNADKVVVAWGNGPEAGYLEYRDWAVLDLLPGPLYCLGRTKAGHPRHPLYLRADTELELFDGR